MKTVMIIGAGMTRAARPKIAMSRRAPLDRDFFQIARLINKSKTKQITNCLSDLVGDYSQELQTSLETTATYLYIKAIDSKNGSIYHKAFLDLLTLLSEVLAKTTNDIPVGPRASMYRLLLSELARVDSPTGLTLITFNYDLLIERALQAITLRGRPGTFVFPGCYRLDGIADTVSIVGGSEFASSAGDHEGVSVLKLHGSMNWESRHQSMQPTPSALLSPTRRLFVLDSPEIPVHLHWKPKTRTVYLKPIIVPPVTGKRGMMHRQVIPLWGKAAEALREADRVVIAGYSCPPLDLEARILISENLRANTGKNVYVIDSNPGSASKFVELCGVDHITMYTSVSDWIRDRIR